MNKSWCLWVVLLFIHGAFGQTFSRVEYFFNTDPAPGQGTVVPVAGTEPVVNFSTNIGVAALSPGFHRLAFRLLETNVGWSHFESRSFYITPADYATDAPAVNAAEYFIDNDPGVGKATSLNVGASGNTVNFIAMIPANLSEGFHRIGIRTRDASNQWGLFDIRTFYISNPIPDAGPITAAEYFFDTDPGPGNGTPIPITPVGNIVHTNTLIPVDLPPGFHRLVIRTRNQEGFWGHFETRTFYIEFPAVFEDKAPIVGIEYFFGPDPGPGKGFTTFVEPGQQADPLQQTIALPTPACLAQGGQTVGIRLIDQNGHYSHYERADVMVSGTVANMNPITLKAGNWSNPAVWNTCEVPTGTLPITVKHLIQVDVNVNCNTLKVEKPANLRVQPGRSLHVNQ